MIEAYRVLYEPRGDRPNEEAGRMRGEDERGG
jgi:hypothetical protein